MTTPHVILGLAKRIWTAIKSVFKYGKRIATLEARVADLEARLEKQPPDACNKCGERAMRVERLWPVMGAPGKQSRQDKWKCQNCGHEEMRIVVFK